MQALLRPLMLLEVAGFFASFLVHLLALLGLPSPFGGGTWLLHLGIFVVWFPTVLIAQRLGKGAKQADLWKAVLRGCPKWMRTGIYVVGGYAIVNFVFFMIQTTDYAKNEVPLLIEYRGFSGHWLIFYYASAATLYSATRIGSLGQRHCPHGHEVSPFANYCDLCGAPIG